MDGNNSKEEIKQLPEKIKQEVFLKLNYANCRFMKSKRAFRTSYNNQNGVWFTAKLENGDENSEKIKMLHLHLRTPAKDRWINEEEDLDIDLYISETEFDKLRELLNDH